MARPRTTEEEKTALDIMEANAKLQLADIHPSEKTGLAKIKEMVGIGQLQFYSGFP